MMRKLVISVAVSAGLMAAVPASAGTAPDVFSSLTECTAQGLVGSKGPWTFTCVPVPDGWMLMWVWVKAGKSR